MSELKRHPGEITADGLSMMSPFHKEMKLDNSQHPGQQYFYLQNNNPDLLIRQNYIQQTQNGYIMNSVQQQQQQQLLQSQSNQLGGSALMNQQVIPNNFFQFSQQSQQQQPQQQQFQAPQLNLAFKPISQQSSSSVQSQQSTQQIQKQTSAPLNLQSSQQSTESNDNSKKSGEKALQYFQTFLQLTQNISDADMNLDFVKDLYTIKLDSLYSNKEMHEIYQKIVSKQGYSKQQKKNWNDQETNLLVWIILKSCVFKRIDFRSITDDVWEDISCMMVGRTAEQCKLKWLSMSKLNLQQQPWCDQEDDVLRKIIKEYEQKNKQNKWSEIAVKLNQLSQKNVFRQGKQCRERWNNHLDPQINRGPWNYEEELKMLKLVLEKGKKWSDISKSMKSQRTENAVKNRYNSLVKKEKGTCSSLQSTNDLKGNQDLSESEKQQITILIEKLESRIKNGFSLVNGNSQNQKNNTDQIEEENEEDTKQQCDYDEDDDDDDDPQQSQSMQSMMNSHMIKTEDGNNNNSLNNQNQTTQPSLFSISRSNPEIQQQNQNQSNKNLPNKSVLQSKQTLFQMVENEAKIQSEQNLNQSDNQIESVSQLNTTSISSNHNTTGIFKPLNQEINIQDLNLFGVSPMQNPNNAIKNQMNEETQSENNSPSMASKQFLSSQPFLFGKGLTIKSQPGSKRVSLNSGSLFTDGGNQVTLPSTPLISGFNHFDMKQQKTQNDVQIKSITKRTMKKEEFEEEIAKNQLVYVDKQSKEIFVITPAFIQQKIQEEFSRNIQVFNQMLQNQESISTPQQHGVNAIHNHVYGNSAIQGSAASISMFLNTPPMQSQNNLHLGQGNQLGSFIQGDATPNLFQQYYNFHPQISNSNLGNNSPSLFFGYYSGNNTPQQLGLSQITPQNNMQHHRMINQMPLHSMMQTHNMPNNNTNSNFVKQNNSVLQSAAMLNKQLMHQDVQQFAGGSNSFTNTNQILQQ